MKYITTILLAIIVIVLIILCIPKSCINSKPSIIEKKANHSYIIDSLNRIHAEKLKVHSDSLISIHEKKDSIAQSQIASITKDYNRARAIIKDLTSAKVDSLGQVVVLPVEEYNAFVESGNDCDSMNILNNKRIVEKDSINSELKCQIKVEQDLNITTKQALDDFVALSKEENGKIDKVKKQRKGAFILGLIIPPLLYVAGKILKVL